MTFYLEKVDDKWRRYYTLFETINLETPRKIEFNKLSNINQIGLRRLSRVRDHLLSNKTKSIIPNKVILENNENNIWTGFYKKPVFERISQINKIFKDIDVDLLKSGGLTLLRADSMIENCIGMINLPVGLGYLINIIILLLF